MWQVDFLRYLSGSVAPFSKEVENSLDNYKKKRKTFAIDFHFLLICGIVLSILIGYPPMRKSMKTDLLD